MSFYNIMNGANPVSSVLLYAAGLEPNDIPRFRDSYLTIDDGSRTINIYTRTGGDNREYYSDHIEALQKRSNYIHDFDDEYDSTYMTFQFTPLDEPDINTLLEIVVSNNLLGSKPDWEKAINNFKEALNQDN